MKRPLLKIRQFRFLALGLSPLWLLALGLPSPAQVSNAPAVRIPRPEPERFLFVLDISSAMQKRATNVQRVVAQMFANGFNGQLHRGDTIGLWTYNNELHTGEFPLQRWTPQVSREISIATVQFIQDLRYSKQSRLAPVMAQLTNVVADSEKITVILVSDGSESLVGTIFDDQITEAFKLNAAEQRRQAMPFVTILRAAKGKFVSLRVNLPPWPVEFPAYPGESLTATPPPTNSPPPRTESPSPKPPVPPAAAPEPKPAILETNQAAPAATNPPAATTPTPSAVEIPSNPAPVLAGATPSTSTNVAPAPRSQTNSPENSIMSSSIGKAEDKPGRRLSLLAILVGAAIAMIGLTILSLALLKRSREAPRVSLITRSLNKDRK